MKVFLQIAGHRIIIKYHCKLIKQVLFLYQQERRYIVLLSFALIKLFSTFTNCGILAFN